MDELSKLRLQEQLLLQELDLIQSKIKFVSLINEAEQQKVSTIPSVANTSQKIVAIPEQTAPGKESTNPLMAVALPKSKTEVQTSITLVKPSDLNLRPNGGIQIPINKPEGQTSVPQNYYVVFNGPNAGIYTSWTIAENAVTGISGIKHKKFKTFNEAKNAANIFTQTQFKPPLELICSAEALRPTYSKALTSPTKSKVKLGKIPKQNQTLLLEDTDKIRDFHYSWFNHLYRIGRNATEVEFKEEHFFTTDKKNISYFNFYPGSDYEMIYEAYQYGLLSLIYPSNSLIEISNFPEEFRKAVNNFKLKCLKNTDKQIFVKISSTVIFWDQQEEPVRPYHYVQIGTVKDQTYSPSKASEATLEKEDLQAIAEQKLIILINKLFSIGREDKIKINLATNNCLMTSYSHKGMTNEDFDKVQTFRRQLVNPYAFGYHFPALCQKVKKEIGKHGIIHTCDKCNPTTKDARTLLKDKGKEIVEEKDA